MQLHWMDHHPNPGLVSRQPVIKTCQLRTPPNKTYCSICLMSQEKQMNQPERQMGTSKMTGGFSALAEFFLLFYFILQLRLMNDDGETASVWWLRSTAQSSGSWSIPCQNSLNSKVNRTKQLSTTTLLFQTIIIKTYWNLEQSTENL